MEDSQRADPSVYIRIPERLVLITEKVCLSNEIEELTSKNEGKQAKRSFLSCSSMSATTRCVSDVDCVLLPQII